MDAVTRAVSGRKAGRMTIISAILLAGGMIAIAIAWSIPTAYDYHTDLKNISYQLSRIADALQKGGKNDGYGKKQG